MTEQAHLKHIQDYILSNQVRNDFGADKKLELD